LKFYFSAFFHPGPGLFPSATLGEHPGQEILYQKSKLYQKSDNKIFLLLNKCKKHNISAEHVELTLRRWTRASVYFSYNTPHRSHPRIS